MHGPCGVPSDESNERYGDNPIKYANRCHLCAAPSPLSLVIEPPKRCTDAEHMTDAKRRSPSKLQLEPQSKKTKACCGVTKGSKRTDRPQVFWENLCRKYEAGKYTSQIAFLRSKDSGDSINEDHYRTFSRNLRKFKEGRLTRRR
ncbi:MAG: hypothetical protein ACREOZ_00465 [Gloeomargaritales cyanobacterium]